MNEKRGFFIIVSSVLVSFFLISLAGGIPSFDIYGETSFLQEDQSPIYSYNFSANVSDPENGTWTFNLESIYSELYGLQNNSFFNWISLNSSSGILSFNSTLNNQTGQYNISVFVKNQDDQGESRTFFFRVNATNDAPVFVGVNSSYNVTQNNLFEMFLNATDEESHSPLIFNSTFVSCELAEWSTRSNCTLFDLSQYGNSALINFTPSRNDVGRYYINLSVTDSGENYTCPYTYCSSDYSENKTRYYSELVEFNVYSTLQVNVSDCQDKIFQENLTDSCIINVDSRGLEDTLNVSSLALLNNYGGAVPNSSWFYASSELLSANASKTINVSLFPGKTEVGNWTINFTVTDLNFSESITQEISILVNRTYNDIPEIASISAQNLSTGLTHTINISVYDDDLLIPDKNQSLGGYNETTTLVLAIFNQTNLNQEISIPQINITLLAMPLNGTNITNAKIEFVPTASISGDYTVYLNATDNEGGQDTEVFNLTIFGNTAPSWNESLVTTIVSYEDSETYLNLSQNVSDLDSGVLSFSFNNDTSFPAFYSGFNTTTGIVNFTPTDFDVGEHLVNITVTDGFLSDDVQFNFTVYNVADNNSIQTPLSVTNGTGDSTVGINVSEDNYTVIQMNIIDDDYKIPSGQTGFYNESQNVTINFAGVSELFNFSLQAINRNSGVAVYQAIFTPTKDDVGSYQIGVNVSDENNNSDFIEFDLIVLETQHSPVISEATNQTSSINRSVIIDFNATDTEDVDESSGNMTFRYSFLNGTDFINNDQSIFNTSSGEFNITFNSSQAGLYRLNISVNDSSNSINSTDFWITVYDSPALYYPSSDTVLNLTEDTASNLSFIVNHTVRDNLTYQFYFNGLRYSSGDYGNGSESIWTFTPNYTDETYGELANMTLIVLNPTYADLNLTQNFSLNVSHANSPVNFTGNIGDKQANYDQQITLDLSSYFSDIDYSDSYYNQTLNLTATSNESSSHVSVSFSNLVATFSAASAASESFNLTVSDLNSSNDSLTSAVSNNFDIIFTNPTTTTVSGGGGSSTTTSFRFILPDPIKVSSGEVVKVDFGVLNDGETLISGIDLSGNFSRSGESVDELFEYSLNPDEVSYLSPRERKNVTLSVTIGAKDAGLYVMKLVGEASSPSITETGEIVFIIENEDIKEKLLFTEQRLAENPECIELIELLKQVEIYLAQGNNAAASSLLTKTLRACDENIAQRALFSPPSLNPKQDDRAFFYLAMFSAVALGVGIVYYVYKEVALRKSIKSYLRKL